ncbi:hypothetical protein MG293_005785 [Ovis ammon polii]|uniref:Uncharacterized protein n=1 Tax=Ovis ammon polii TaxID=230172 RepID=A0AAD4UIY3_OVIAM|nr:hypothetical protein MG293_005785 [Ovis ammon polii]
MTLRVHGHYGLTLHGIMISNVTSERSPVGLYPSSEGSTGFEHKRSGCQNKGKLKHSSGQISNEGGVGRAEDVLLMKYSCHFGLPATLQNRIVQLQARATFLHVRGHPVDALVQLTLLFVVGEDEAGMPSASLNKP